MRSPHALASPARPRSRHTSEYAVDPIVVAPTARTTVVRTAPGKRRKVVSSRPTNALSQRRTRPDASTKTSAVSKTIKQLQEEAKAEKQKELHDTFEKHDDKIRELFHLTKFVTLVDYDAEAAKQDESEVFKEVFYSQTS
jgi:hypothetical protein